MKLWSRLISGFNEQAAIATFAGGAVGALSGIYIGADKGAVIGLITVIIIVAIATLNRRQGDLVPEPMDLSLSQDFTVVFSTPSLVDEAIEIAQEAFPDSIIPAARVRRLTQLDPDSLSIAVDYVTQRAIGYLDCYAVNEGDFLTKFTTGEYSEEDFDLSAATPKRLATAKCLFYLAGLVVVEENKARRGRIARSLIVHQLSSLQSTLPTACTRIRFISVAYTQHGKRLLEAFGFQPRVSAIERKDGGVFYEARIDLSMIGDAIARIDSGSHRNGTFLIENRTSPSLVGEVL